MTYVGKTFTSQNQQTTKDWCVIKNRNDPEKLTNIRLK